MHTNEVFYTYYAKKHKFRNDSIILKLYNTVPSIKLKNNCRSKESRVGDVQFCLIIFGFSKRIRNQNGSDPKKLPKD